MNPCKSMALGQVAVIDPLDTRTWISLGIEAASQSPATREFNMGVLQT